MNGLLTAFDSFLYHDFIFSPRLRLVRHLVYWTVHIILWALFWMVMGTPGSFGRNVFNMLLWVPVFIVFSYPLVYGAIPHLLLKGKVVQFFLLMLAWGVVGFDMNGAFRTYVYAPLQQTLGFEANPVTGPQAHSYLCMTTSAASAMIIQFFKLWTLKQRDWLQAQQARITAELQLLKAQVHPHFLFNTLNNIYAFSIDSSPKTPGLILKLSSLLNYMLYDCKSDRVPLEKEIEVMKNYLDLEKERYGNTIDIAWIASGSIAGRHVSPLLMLPFLENAFKHGVSEQIEKPWLQVTIGVVADILHCTIANSKNNFQPHHPNGNGIGIANVKKRLALMYPGSYELVMRDEGNFFVASLQVNLAGYRHTAPPAIYQTTA